MHNSLKYFRDNSKDALFAQMQQFISNEKVSGKSISIEHNGEEVVALLGYLPGNETNMRYSIFCKEIGAAAQDNATLQTAIDKVADEVGSFICQSSYIEHGILSVAFLTGE